MFSPLMLLLSRCRVVVVATRPDFSWEISMAALRLLRDSSKALLPASAVCNCGLPCSRNFFTLAKNGKKVMLPSWVIKVAKYYEKPKEKKGPSAGSWAFLAGATTGILLGAVAYFGNFYRSLFFAASSPC